MYASDSDEDGPDQEVDEEGFTKDEVEVHEKVLGRDPRILLMCDLSLADEATVDSGKGMANKNNDGDGVNYSKLWADALAVVRERKEKEEEEERKRKEVEEEEERKRKETFAREFEWVVQLARDLRKKEDEAEGKKRKKEEEDKKRKKEKEEEEMKKKKEKEDEERKMRSNARPPCADQAERPRRAYRTSKAHGKEVPICWCEDDCIVKESIDYNSDTWGRKFFMCANYARSPVRTRNPYETPPSPPPVYRYYTWIDLEQSEATKAIQEIDSAIVRRWYQEVVRNKEMAARRKQREDERRKQEEEEKRIAKEARDAERERKRQTAWRSQEEGEKRKKKGKWPRVLDL
uniref:Uncharacterized protein n=1 Tax=Avena sativa TaxID=4498 RepID=A0ACD5ZYK4_AVESA